MFEIIKSKGVSDRYEDFVAIGNIIDDDMQSSHSAFVIQYNKLRYEFHYTGREVEYVQLTNDYFHKITDTILADEVPAFIAQCINILKKARPTYGFFYSGECYEPDGTYKSPSSLEEVMTCVGFCLNVLKGFLEDEYIVYSDWTEDTHETKGYLEKYCKDHNIDQTKIASSHRRITPRECLTSCFYTQLPITKEMIVNKIVQVNEFFLSKLN